MNLSYFIGKFRNLKKFLFWFMAVLMIIIFVFMAIEGNKYLSPAARYIYKGISLSK